MIIPNVIEKKYGNERVYDLYSKLLEERIIVLVNVILWLFYDTISGAYGNLAVHGIQLVSTVLSMLPHKLNKANETA